MPIKNEWNNAKRIVIIIIDTLIFNFSVLIGFCIKFGIDIPSYNFISYEKSVIYISLFFIFLNLLLGTYVFYNRTVSDIVFVTVIGQFLTILFIMIISFAGRWFTFPRSVLIYSFIIGIIILSLWRIFVYYMYIKVSSLKRVVILGTESSVVNAAQNFLSEKNQKHQVTSIILGHYYENLRKILDEIDIVYISSNLNNEEKNKIYQLVVKNEKKLFLKTSFENLIMINPNMMNFEDESIIEVSDFRIPSENNFFKRVFDITVSLLLIVITSPIMLITAILVKLTSPGEIIYKQKRITYNQKEFSIFKFRTMSATAEEKSGPVLSSTNDNRITLIGKYLRALRIDELPQLINVIRGDMSIVGPRPERPFFVNKFNEANPYYYLRHNVKAGITGYAQVYGKYASDYNSKLNFDLLYIKNYSFLLDLKILLQTIKILFDKVSSKGIDEERNKINLDFLKENKIRLYN